MIKYKRLEKLANFLDNLKPKQFDFDIVVTKRECGTVGCALGWTPHVFPRLAKWTWTLSDLGSTPLLQLRSRKSNTVDYLMIAHEIFGLDLDEAGELFNPNMERPWVQNNSTLGPRASPKQVANSIRKFIEWRKKKK